MINIAVGKLRDIALTLLIDGMSMKDGYEQFIKIRHPTVIPVALSDAAYPLNPAQLVSISVTSPAFKFITRILEDPYYVKTITANNVNPECSSIILFYSGLLGHGYAYIRRIYDKLITRWEVTSVYRDEGSHRICSVDVAPRIAKYHRYSHHVGMDPRLYARRRVLTYLEQFASALAVQPAYLQIAVEDNHLHIHSLAMLLANGVGDNMPRQGLLYKVNHRPAYSRTIEDEMADKLIITKAGRLGSVASLAYHPSVNDYWYPRF